MQNLFFCYSVSYNIFAQIELDTYETTWFLGFDLFCSSSYNKIWNFSTLHLQFSIFESFAPEKNMILFVYTMHHVCWLNMSCISAYGFLLSVMRCFNYQNWMECSAISYTIENGFLCSWNMVSEYVMELSDRHAKCIILWSSIFIISRVHWSKEMRRILWTSLPRKTWYNNLT